MPGKGRGVGFLRARWRVPAGQPGEAGGPVAGDGPGSWLDQIQSVMSLPSLAAGADGDAAAGALG